MKQMQKRPLLFQSTRPAHLRERALGLNRLSALWGDFLEHPAPINAVNERDGKASGDKTADYHLDRYRFSFFHLALMPNESCSSTVQLKADRYDEVSRVNSVNFVNSSG